MEVLKGFNAPKLYHMLFQEDSTFEGWLKDLGLLFGARICTCGGNMGLKRRSGERYQTWRCNRAKCGKEKGFLVGTFFEGAHITLKEAIHLSYLWCRQTHTQDEVMFDLRRGDGSSLSSSTITDWNNFFREICIEYYIRNPIRLGGNNILVEIDETVITKRKYERGRLIENQQWIFGLIEYKSGRCVLIPVENRDAETLLPIIQY